MVVIGGISAQQERVEKRRDVQARVDRLKNLDLVRTKIKLDGVRSWIESSSLGTKRYPVYGSFLIKDPKQSLRIYFRNDHNHVKLGDRNYSGGIIGSSFYIQNDKGEEVEIPINNFPENIRDAVYVAAREGKVTKWKSTVSFSRRVLGAMAAFKSSPQDSEDQSPKVKAH